ncbi:hypothetical protein Metvu_1641 [Methanocaldococcus vulcanius M7]|uniref:Uncharacterized protein n=1 Tax=Methanocaldococcus vulcanius (strain ATCC 700851 / DSM 12094 / M7) TaxID=579137 RepID=C9RDW5_METVM|nr:DUF4013 domain-containing protein [Methanocaldococcus vulcanius]ACX73494.1 hypothetical protein Metvu_1641 [Methanocaldococcus vulcanius M7]
MNQIIKKLIIEPLIYPFYKGNYKNFIILGLILTILVAFVMSYLLQILAGIYMPSDIFVFYMILLPYFIPFIIMLGYILMVFESSIYGKDDLPNLDAKKLILYGFKAFGYILLLLLIITLVFLIWIILYETIKYGNSPLYSRAFGLFPPFSYIAGIIFLILVIFMANLIILCSVLSMPSYECFTLIPWSFIGRNMSDYLIIAIVWFFFPIILFKLYNRNINLKKLVRFTFFLRYFLIFVISGIYLLLIFKIVLFVDYFKTLIIFYLLIVIARMFGVYFREVENNYKKVRL